MVLLNIHTAADLASLRGRVRPVAHDDERLLSTTITLYRDDHVVGMIEAASDDLAWDAFRLCAGLRFRAETVAPFDPALLGHGSVAELVAFSG